MTSQKAAIDYITYNLGGVSNIVKIEESPLSMRHICNCAGCNMVSNNGMGVVYNTCANQSGYLCQGIKELPKQQVPIYDRGIFLDYYFCPCCRSLYVNKDCFY